MDADQLKPTSANHRKPIALLPALLLLAFGVTIGWALHGLLDADGSRYMPFGATNALILDTHTGEVYKIAPDGTRVPAP